MTILLRTLARKSVLDFGKHNGWTVQQCLDMKNHRILRWYYYNCSMISFLPDILDEIGIPEDKRIDKPGKAPEIGEALDKQKEIKRAIFRREAYESGDTEALKKINHDVSIERKRRVGTYCRFKRDDRSRFSKGRMQSINHGRGGTL